MAQQSTATGDVEAETESETGVWGTVKSAFKIGDLPNYVDAGVLTRWFSVEVSVCAFRDGVLPSVRTDGMSIDLFVPLPGERTLWIALVSWWIAERLGRNLDLGGALVDVIPDPPYECEVDGCDYECENYGMFLVHDQREHAPTGE